MWSGSSPEKLFIDYSLIGDRLEVDVLKRPIQVWKRDCWDGRQVLLSSDQTKVVRWLIIATSKPRSSS